MFLDTLDGPIILMGDVNGHHQAWGRHPTNKRGSEIMDLAETRNLVLLNDGSITWTSGWRESTVDVSFASESIIHRLLWYASDDPRGSDHHPISIHLDENPLEMSRRPRWLYKQADWKTYQDTTKEHCRQNTYTTITDFTEMMYHAATETIPRTSATPGKKALHWWSPSIKVAIRARKKALRASKRAEKRLPVGHPDREAALQNYRTKRNECRDIIRAAKKESWESFINGINPSQSTTDLWSKVNAISGKRKARGITIVHEGVIIRDPIEIVDTIGNYFASLSSNDSYDEEFRRKNHPTINSIRDMQIPDDLDNLEINRPFSLEEFSLALSKARGGSAGPDEVGYPLIRNLSIREQVKFLKLLNQEWTQDTFPDQWRHSLTIPIPKPSSGGHEVDQYRPISLTCCASKLLERMVNRRLLCFLEEGNLLDHRQHAFRPGHGTNTYFGTLSEALQDSFSKNLHAELVTLDLSKAYNRAWMPGVLDQLKKWGLKGHILKFIQGFLYKRTFQVTLGNCRSKTFNEETGVPQGSVIAVTLFLIRMNDVFTRLPVGIFIFVYADDIVLMAVKKTMKALRRKLIQATNYVSTWASSAGFQLSATKSGYIHICPLKHPVLSTKVCIKEHPIPFRKTIRILGVRFDRHLSFDPHFNDVKSGCKKRINLLKTLAGRHPNANRGSRLNVAKAIINSRLTYGIEVTFLAKHRLIKKLAPVYQRTVRVCSSLLPGTPGIAACIEGGLLPFDRFISKTICERAIGLYEKTSGVDEEDYLLAEANNSLREASNPTLPPVSKVYWVGARGWHKPKILTDLTIKRQFRAGANPSAVTQAVLELQNRKYGGYTIRYSDGSIAQGKVGIGIYGPNLAKCHSLPAQCSIFTAEAIAAFIAATMHSDRPIAIFTDSASVVTALKSDTSKHPWIQAIQEYAPNNTVFVWIPGHCGVHGNIEADRLANSGRYKAKYTRRVPGSDLKKWVSKVTNEGWARDWAANETDAIRKIKGDISRWQDPPLHREQVVISRLRTQHTNISHNYKGNGPFHRICDLCQTPQTVEHVICHCPKYEAPRTSYDIPGSMHDALGNEPTRVAAILGFLRKAGLFDLI